MDLRTRQRLDKLDRLADFLDESIRIPVIGYRIGYDALVGMIPGVGDIVGMVVSSYIVLQAARFRIPRATLLRMIANVAVEALIGAIPLLGDVFDATYKANLRNVRLLHSRLEEAETPAAEDKRYLVTLLLIPALLGVVILIAVVAAIVLLV
jgi:hypothetical protein